MRALDKKLFRDLLRLWAQELAIALVMASGVATLILAVGTYGSLEQTRAAYYQRYRFGDVFATAVRAPKALADRIAAIDGVAAVETRIEAHAILDIEGMREPATGRIISIPEARDLSVNALFLREGRLPESGRANEAVVNETFATAHGFAIGASFGAIIDGAKTKLTIVGIALSPEFIYALGPGDMMPDSRRYGIVWMSEKALASLTDLDGAFNSVSLRLLRGASEAAIIDGLDRVLKRYGGTGAYARKDQMSNAFLDSELTQLRAMAEIIPPIFLLVSAFLINMILSRLIALEREQIGLLKALGYGGFAILWHYLKLVLVIAVIGILIGAIAGTWLGRGMTRLYSEFYSFPFLIFRRDPDIYLIAAGVSILAAVAGAAKAIATAFALPAAVAMRPPAPPVYRRLLRGSLERWMGLSQLTVMAFRHMLRHPLRTGMTAIGVSFAVSLMLVALGSLDSVTAMMDAIFFRTERENATLLFSSARPAAALQAVEHLPGVLQAEPYLTVPVRLTNGQYSRQLTITGKPPVSDLSRVLDMDLRPVRVPESGLLLGDRVAEILHVRPGDLVEVEMLDGARRVVEAPVTAVIQSYIGLMVFMDIDALARLSGTGPRVSGVHLGIDQAHLDDLYRAVKRTPRIGAIALEMVAEQRFKETMRQNMMTMLTVYLVLAVIIAFGVVYNSARIQLSERGRELATLRVLGFGRAEVSNVLFIELGTIVAVAQPAGWLIGTLFGLIVTRGLASDLFRVPFVIVPGTFAIASLVTLAAALVSALIVRGRIDRLDLIRVLKTRE